MINIKSFCFNYFQENCYLLWDEAGECVIVDPGCYKEAETASLIACLESNSLTPKAIWLTHGHLDHIFGVAELSRKYSVPVFMAPEDRMTIEANRQLTDSFGLKVPDSSFGTVDLEDGQVLSVGEGFPTFRVIATPGHTPGSVCLYSESCKVLLTGDTLFAGAIGRTDLAGGDYDKEITSIMDRLMDLPGDVDVLPGHGPCTSIAEERTGNPFLQPFNEPWEDID